MSITLTDTQVLATLIEVAGENPEKVYEVPAIMADEWGSCFYVHHNEDGTQSAGCIVGQVLHRLGVSLENLKKAETYGASAAVGLAGVDGLSERMKDFLRSVQRKQDDGHTWGDSLTLAQAAYPEFTRPAQPLSEAVA